MNAGTIRASSASEATRTSISADALAGTTLGVVPPWIDADVDRRSRGRVFECLNFKIWWASSTMALRPSSGATPACAALPLHIELEPAHALARRLEPAIGQGRFQNQNIGRFNRQFLDQPARRGTADLLVRGKQHPDRPRHAFPVIS